jgi:hypothetical protein
MLNPHFNEISGWALRRISAQGTTAMDNSNSTISVEQLVAKIVQLYAPETRYLFSGEPSSFDIDQLEFMRDDAERQLLLAERDNVGSNEVQIHKKAVADLAKLIKFAESLKTYLMGAAEASRQGQCDSMLVFVFTVDERDPYQHPVPGIVKPSAYKWAKQKYQVEVPEWDMPSPTGQLSSNIRESIRTGTFETNTGRADNTPGRATASARQVESSTSSPPHTGKHANEEVALFLVAVALAQLLDQLREGDASVIEEDPFENEDGTVNKLKITEYVASASFDRIGNNTPQIIDGRSRIDSRKKTEITLYMFAKTLACTLDEALDRGRIVVWQDPDTKDQLERFNTSNWKFNSAALQRYISRFILCDEIFSGQQPTALQKRFTLSHKNTTDQKISELTREDILNCLQSATGQYGRAKADVELDKEPKWSVRPTNPQ